jgi:hypothetical protein
VTKKPNFAKFILGVTALALLFIGTWATTHAPRTIAAKDNISSDISTKVSHNVTTARLNAGNANSMAPVSAISWENVFEIDGDARDSTCGDITNPLCTDQVLPDDWNDFLPGNVDVNTTGAIQGSGPPGNALVWSFITDPPLKTDLIYTGGGSKDFNEITSWKQVARGTGPPKDDVEHAYAAKYHDTVTGHDVLVFGGDRPTNNGDANIGFWFFQNPINPVTSGPDKGSFTGTHKNGDVFVLSAFAGGGGNVGQIRVLVWVGDDPTTAASVCTAAPYGGVIDPKSDTTDFPQGSLCDITKPNSTSGTGITNSGDIQVSWQYLNKDNKTTCTTPGTNTPPGCTIPTPDFFEGAVDLNVLGLANECFASFLLETRSSNEVSAVLKDFALGGFANCSVDVTKTVSPDKVCTGVPTDVTYTYSVTNPTGSTLTVTLVDDNGTPGNAADDFCVVPDNASCSTYSASSASCSFTLAPNETKSCMHTINGLTLTTDPRTNIVTATATAGGTQTTATASATVKVNPTPSVSISATACGTSVTLTANPSGGSGGGDPANYTYLWSTGATSPSISVTAAGPYSVTVKDANACADDSTATVGVCCVNCPTP